MVLRSKQDYLATIRTRYQQAGKKAKTLILDEFCATCGYNRKYAIRKLSKARPKEMAPTKMTHCYAKEYVKDQKKTITTDKNCTVIDLKQSGNKVTRKMKCTGKNTGVFSGETVYKGDSYDSTMKMESQGQTMNMKVKAKRLGDMTFLHLPHGSPQLLGRKLLRNLAVPGKYVHHSIEDGLEC